MLVLKLFLNVKLPVSPVHGSSDVHSCEPNKRNDGSEYILLQNEATAANQKNDYSCPRFHCIIGIAVLFNMRWNH